jgi:hypothetical protein
MEKKLWWNMRERMKNELGDSKFLHFNWISNEFLMSFQGEICTNHENLTGSCIEFPKCTSLYNEYRADPKQSIDKIRANQRICGNRRPARDPLVCCSEGIQSPAGSTGSTSGSKLISREDGCGITKVQHNRVVGGVPAEKGEWKFQVHEQVFNVRVLVF